MLGYIYILSIHILTFLKLKLLSDSAYIKNGLFVFVDKWSPALQIRTVLLSIQALLSAPNPDDPLANDVAEQWKNNEAKAIQTGGYDKCSWFCKSLQ